MPEGDCTELGAAALVTEADAEALVRGICFKTGPPRTVGVEVEWLVHEPRRPRLPLPPERLDAAYAALGALPLSSALTVEPGGQLELSSLPAASLMDCVSAVSADLTAVRTALAAHGFALTGLGTDPWRPPRRLLHEPRYDAMETWLDRAGPAGRAMMCSSASVQVCLDAGYEEPGPLGHGRRWRLSHLLGAVLVSAFANSPMLWGRPTGWRSTRQAVWEEIDRGRSGHHPSTRSRARPGSGMSWTRRCCASARTAARGTCRTVCRCGRGCVPVGRGPPRAVTSSTTSPPSFRRCARAATSNCA